MFQYQLRNDMCTLSLRGAQWCHARSICGYNSRRSSQPPLSSHASYGEPELEPALQRSTCCHVRSPSQIDAAPVDGLGLLFVPCVAEGVWASGGPHGPAISKLLPSSRAARHNKGREEPQQDEHEPRAHHFSTVSFRFVLRWDSSLCPAFLGAREAPYPETHPENGIS